MSALDEVKDLAEAVARRRSLRLWDVEMAGRPGQSVLRIFVDADGGVDIDTVAEVSEELSRGLDLRDPIPGRYTLEVSTPGLERTLKSPEHFRLSVGRSAVVKTTTPLVGNSNRIDGDIVSADADGVTLKVEDDGEVTVPYGAVKSARTVFEWKRG
ncbi:MAG: ribosome maturation factor RimP [Actinomycetota bacterium]|nr:ribosome maturation factor RimP [Actinomycetota bacterium]